MNLDELLARESIRDLVARYNAAGDSGRFEDVLELFWPDASMVIGRGDDAVTKTGHDEIRTIFTGTADRWKSDGTSGGAPAASGPRAAAPASYVRHRVATLVIDVESSTSATAYSYFAVIMPHGLDHWGRYFDRFEARDGVWRFSSRKVVGEGSRARN
jgi:uncharacterized protein (TIGR02246 family)